MLLAVVRRVLEVLMLEAYEKRVEKLAFTIKEAAIASTLSEPKIRKDIRSGTLRSRLVGTRRLILKADLIAYLNGDCADVDCSGG